MAIFEWHSNSKGADLSGTFDNATRLYSQNIHNGNYTILSDTVLSNGKASYYIDGGFDHYEDYKEWRLSGNNFIWSEGELTIKKYGELWIHELQKGHTIRNLDTGIQSGYITEYTTTNYETGELVTVKHNLDWSRHTGDLYKDHDWIVEGNDTFYSTKYSDKISAGDGNDVIYGYGGDDILDGESGSDIINAGDGSDLIRGGTGGDSITPGKGNDDVDGGSGVDEVWFSGKSSDYQFSGTSSYLTVKDIGSGSNDGIDTLKNIENLRFTDGLLTTSQSLNLSNTVSTSTSTSTSSSNYSSSSIDSLTGLIIDSTYRMDGIRDYDGNLHGYLGNAPVDVITDYKFQGWAHTSSSIYKEGIFTNKDSGRWATVEDFDDDKIDYLNYGQGGGTRIVGVYQDPLVAAGVVQKDSVFDGSRTFINDLKLDNLILKDSWDYDGDGFQEIYFSKVDNTAYLRAVMHADGNIQYANYQNLEQMTDYLTSNGFADTIDLIA